MLDHAREALEFARGKTREDLENDRLRHLALVRLVEVVGEAASRVPKTVQDSHPDIPWRGVIGTRNRLIHGYDIVDNERLWIIVTKDLPDLVETLKRHPGTK
jgi:uncharacterized protein with HEPN domain